MIVVTTLAGHPRKPETFEFSERLSAKDGRLLRVTKSHVAFDAAWPWWKRSLVGALSLSLARLALPKDRTNG